MVDRSVRSLEHLESSASTARVLNLRVVSKRKGHDPDYKARPLFKNASLNTSIILKHRLRGNEVEQFPLPRRTATKLLVPIETNDLRLGARYVFVGQRHFDQALFEAFGLTADAQDMRTLQILDETPTLDPFLLREQLRRQGVDAANCYFELSQADTQRMFDFAQREIEPLVRMSLGDNDSAHAQAAKLAQKILANSADKTLDPLRRTMQLDHAQFQEGAFCWKAFLYYKWQLADLLPRVGPVLQQMEQIKPRGPQNDETRIYLKSTREVLHKALVGACRKVKGTLEIYDQAYIGLTQNSDPTAFRDFLLKAPALFNELGERLGGIEHILSFWRFRFPGNKLPVVTPEELTDIFMDFEASLSIGVSEEKSILPPPEVLDVA